MNNREKYQVNHGDDNLAHKRNNNNYLLIENENDDWMEGVDTLQYIANKNKDNSNDVEVR